MSMNRRTFSALLAGVALSLPVSARAQDTFPVTFTHALGETVLPAKPTRIVTIGWMTQDAVIALGEKPVAMPIQIWGGDADGILPWVREGLEAMGGDLPRLINFDTDIPYEQVLALEPDLILAPYSGLTPEQYARLASIAPTVAYPDEVWSGSWQDVVRTTGRALGRSAEAEALIAATLEGFEHAASANPQFAGKTFVIGSTWNGPGVLSVYVSTDPRVHMISDLGFVPAPGVLALPTDQGYLADISLESLGSVDADLLITFDDADPISEQLYASPLFQRYRPVAERNHAHWSDRAFVMALSAPSPLSIPWMLDRLVPDLAEALAS